MPRPRSSIGLNASGRSPAATSIELFKTKGLSAIPTHGPLSWSVPGCVDGWDQLRKRFGTKALSELLAPAIEYAETGFPVSEIIAADWRGAEPSLKPIPTSAACFLPGVTLPRKGRSSATRVSPGRCEPSPRMVATRSTEVLWPTPSCDTRNRSAACSRFRILPSTPAISSIPSRPITEATTSGNCRPTRKGIAVLQMLNLLEPFDLKSMGPQSAEALHLMIEAKKLAYEDRAKFYADPDFAKLPIATLISKPYANRRRAELNPDKANLSPIPGDPAQADTIYLTVVDKDFNCVSLIQSNFHGFGSHHVPGDLGFVHSEPWVSVCP